MYNSIRISCNLFLIVNPWSATTEIPGLFSKLAKNPDTCVSLTSGIEPTYSGDMNNTHPIWGTSNQCCGTYNCSTKRTAYRNCGGLREGLTTIGDGVRAGVSFLKNRRKDSNNLLNRWFPVYFLQAMMAKETSELWCNLWLQLVRHQIEKPDQTPSIWASPSLWATDQSEVAWSHATIFLMLVYWPSSVVHSHSWPKKHEENKDCFVGVEASVERHPRIDQSELVYLPCLTSIFSAWYSLPSQRQYEQSLLC